MLTTAMTLALISAAFGLGVLAGLLAVFGWAVRQIEKYW